VANCNEKPQPESGGTGGGAFHLRDGDATKQSRYEPSRPYVQSTIGEKLFPKELDKLSNVIKDRRARLGSLREKTTTKKALPTTSRGEVFLDSGSQLLWSGEYCARSVR
jgi:hypothetical protein